MSSRLSGPFHIRGKLTSRKGCKVWFKPPNDVAAAGGGHVGGVCALDFSSGSYSYPSGSCRSNMINAINLEEERGRGSI